MNEYSVRYDICNGDTTEKDSEYVVATDKTAAWDKIVLKHKRYGYECALLEITDTEGDGDEYLISMLCECGGKNYDVGKGCYFVSTLKAAVANGIAEVVMAEAEPHSTVEYYCNGKSTEFTDIADSVKIDGVLYERFHIDCIEDGDGLEVLFE